MQPKCTLTILSHFHNFFWKKNTREILEKNQSKNQPKCLCSKKLFLFSLHFFYILSKKIRFYYITKLSYILVFCYIFNIKVSKNYIFYLIFNKYARRKLQDSTMKLDLILIHFFENSFFLFSHTSYLGKNTNLVHTF